MNTLKTLQTLSKVGKIVSKILLIFCIVGFCLCLVGIVSLALGVPALKVGEVTLESILQNEADTTVGTLYSKLSACMILCAAEGILARFALHYFDRELQDGTPFDLDGAKEMLRLGILAICLPIGGQAAAQIVHAILVKAFVDVAPLDLDGFGSAAIGVMLIVMSLICRCGAEIQAGDPNDAAQ